MLRHASCGPTSRKLPSMLRVRSRPHFQIVPHSGKLAVERVTTAPASMQAECLDELRQNIEAE
jgi:hypothetical protein